ncbi:hypothetical protein FHS21_005220 [Phyllobacterium trifolii]|uniref:Toprim domain-containing protein n=1 Tax=Phyllobacterium trifolii TaxID=300193 RepID=A0A839UJ44_9HYPH|nr:hypothetical protein [Phyllobacterium trifolii]MBB3148772.1 hypothetical protein [Phyllobacterium trifolii]
MTERMDYQSLLALAKEVGCKVTDLVALSPSNDPFYAGRADRRQAAEWFMGIWEQFGFRHGAHLRRMHYVLISQPLPIIRPDGQPYTNTLTNWKYFGKASLSARYLKMLPFGALADRRNDPPIIYADDSDNMPDPDCYVTDGHAGLAIPRMEIAKPYAFASGFTARQDFLVEVWVEKSTQNDILVPLASKLGFNLVIGMGDTSETLARQAVERIISDGRPTRILYISDFDPSGRGMPVGLARKIQFWIQELEADHLDVTLQPILLLPEQCVEYQLPRTPIKETDRRGPKFEERFGEGATELDALESLHPGVMAEIVTREVGRYLDPTLARRIRAAEADFDAAISDAEHHVLSRYDLDRYQAQADAARTAYMDVVTPIEESLEELLPEISGALDDAVPEYDPDDFPKPRPTDPDPAPLFDSKRSVIEQGDHYNRWKGK